jgi:hypothetical protein
MNLSFIGDNLQRVRGPRQSTGEGEESLCLQDRRVQGRGEARM